jgi:hypothetical protein
MSLVRPNAVLTVDGQRLSAAEAALVRAELRLGLGMHDALELLVWPRSKLASPSVGGSVTLSLGDKDSEDDVFSGEVAAVQPSADGILVEAIGATIALSRQRLCRTWVQQSVADIVNDLAGSATVDEVEGDLQLEVYTVDDRRTAWSHLVELAELVGADLGASAAGGLRFVPPKTGDASVTLRFGAELLGFTAGPAPQPTAATVGAHGAASEAGSDDWHWLLRAPNPSGSSGGRMRTPGAVRTRDAADSIAQSLADRASRAQVRGRLVAVGRADLRPGDLVDTSDLPSDPGTLRVLDATHVLDARTGWYTAYSVEGAS